jgi:23S rRNA pseudouridine2604 synthase
VTKETPYIFRIILVQGLNRQIRRMCEYFGYEVVQLERIRVMNINIKGLGVGEWRELKEKELKVLFEMIKDSAGTDTSSRRKKGSSSAEFWTERPTRKSSVAGTGSSQAKPAGSWVEKPTSKRAVGKTAAKRVTLTPPTTPEWPTEPGRPAGPATGIRPDGPGYGKSSRPAGARTGAGAKPRSAAAGRGPKSPAGPPKGKTSSRGTRGASRPGKRS